MPLKVVANVPSSCGVFWACGSGVLRNTETATHVVLVYQTPNCTVLSVSAREYGNMHCQ